MITKEWIDNASYEELLVKWRHCPTGEIAFQGDKGQYFADKMAEKRDALSPADQVRASKNVGW